MKKIFCLIIAVLVFLSSALSAQEFNPARGPLEGVWEIADEEIIIFTGNVILQKNMRASFYDVIPGMVYKNGEAFGPVEPNEIQTEYDTMFDYELSENTLKIITEGDEIIYTKKRDDILQNKGPLEGIWKGAFSDSDSTGTLIWIIAGELLIEAYETGSYTKYGGGTEFIYSDLDNTIIAMGETISCAVSGDTMTLSDGSQTVALTRKFFQEIVSDDDITTGNKKYAILYYYYQTYDDIDYVKNFIEKIEELEPYSRIELIQAYREYQDDDIIYYFSGEYISSSTECGNRIERIKLTDKITGDETRDELITDLTMGYKKFWSYEEITETGHDHIGEYKIRKRYEIGKAEYFLELFKTDYWNARNELLNIEYIDELYNFY